MSYKDEDKLIHTIHIRGLSHAAYETMWNLRRYYGAKSWAELIEKIAKKYAADIRDDWI